MVQTQIWSCLRDEDESLPYNFSPLPPPHVSWRLWSQRVCSFLAGTRRALVQMQLVSLTWSWTPTPHIPTIILLSWTWGAALCGLNSGQWQGPGDISFSGWKSLVLTDKVPVFAKALGMKMDANLFSPASKARTVSCIQKVSLMPVLLATSLHKYSH